MKEVLRWPTVALEIHSIDHTLMQAQGGVRHANLKLMATISHCSWARVMFGTVYCVFENKPGFIYGPARLPNISQHFQRCLIIIRCTSPPAFSVLIVMHNPSIESNNPVPEKKIWGYMLLRIGQFGQHPPVDQFSLTFRRFERESIKPWDTFSESISFIIMVRTA